jgi:hypothetical protein
MRLQRSYSQSGAAHARKPKKRFRPGSMNNFGPTIRISTIEERIGEANEGLFLSWLVRKERSPPGNGRCCFSRPKYRARARARYRYSVVAG